MTKVVGGMCVALLMLLPACGDSPPPLVVDTPTSTERTGTSTTSAPTSTSTASMSTIPDAKVIEVTVVGGMPQGGVRTERVTLNETVILRVTSDVADEVHVHSYDVKADVGPGSPVELRFEATIPGVFEVELEQRGREILELEVRPG